MSDDKTNVLVGVGSIGLSTDDGENHTLVVGDAVVDLTSMELDCLHTAIHAHKKALEK